MTLQELYNKAKALIDHGHDVDLPVVFDDDGEVMDVEYNEDDYPAILIVRG